MDKANTLIAVFAALWPAFGYYRITKRLKRAEVNKADINNDILASSEWKDIANERKDEIGIKDRKIDQLYAEISDWRNKYNDLLNQNAELQIDNTKKSSRICNKPGCAEREPQTGF